MARARKRPKTKKEKAINGRMQSGDIQFLLAPPKQTRGWTDIKIRKYVAMMKTRRSHETITKELDLTPSAQKTMLSELKLAAKEGYNLLDYLKKGRPLKTSARKLA